MWSFCGFVEEFFKHSQSTQNIKGKKKYYQRFINIVLHNVDNLIHLPWKTLS